MPLVFPHHFHRLILSRDYSSFFWLADFSSWLLFTFLICWFSHVITPTILIGWFCHLNTPLTFDWLILSCDYSSHFWLADSVIWLFGWYFGQSYRFIHKVYAMLNEKTITADWMWPVPLVREFVLGQHFFEPTLDKTTELFETFFYLMPSWHPDVTCDNIFLYKFK